MAIDRRNLFVAVSQFVLRQLRQSRCEQSLNDSIVDPRIKMEPN